MKPLDLVLWRMTLEPRDTVPYDLEGLLARRRKNAAQANLLKARISLARAQERIGLDLGAMLDRVSK